MVNTNKLKGKMAERGVSGTALADILGMVQQTFYRKIKVGVFDSDEIEKMADTLEITGAEEFLDIFFPQIVTTDVTQ